MVTNIELPKLDYLLKGHFIIFVIIEERENIQNSNVTDILFGLHQFEIIFELLNGCETILVSVVSIIKKRFQVLIRNLSRKTVRKHQKRSDQNCYFYYHLKNGYLIQTKNQLTRQYEILKRQMIRKTNKNRRFASSFCSTLIVFSCMMALGRTFNESICLSFQYDGMHFVVNTQFTQLNVIENNNTLIYNYCHQFQYYCDYTNNVINASLIVKNISKNKCYPYKQSQIQLIDTNNKSAGVKVIYALDIITNDSEIPTNIVKQYACKVQNNVQKHCPQVDYSIVWSYFNQNQLTYTIVTEVIGVIMMLLGIYIYRVTIILLGSATVFVALVSAEAYIAFTPGVSSSFLSNVLIMTAVCSFVAGYVFGYFPKVGLFCMGLWIGAIISLTLNNIALYYIQSTPSNLALYIVLPILGVAFGILTIFIKKSFIIFATSLIGAYMCLRALSWHLGAFPNEFLYSRQYHLGLVGTIQWQFYLYVIALLILTASASALQYWLFNKKMGSSQSKDIDQHLEDLQHKVEQQRGKVMQFKDVFKKGSNEPRKLRKDERPSMSSQQMDQNDFKQDDDNQDNQRQNSGSVPSQKQDKKKKRRKGSSDQQTSPVLGKNELMKRLIVKKR